MVMGTGRLSLMILDRFSPRRGSEKDHVRVKPGHGDGSSDTFCRWVCLLKHSQVCAQKMISSPKMGEKTSKTAQVHKNEQLFAQNGRKIRKIGTHFWETWSWGDPGHRDGSPVSFWEGFYTKTCDSYNMTCFLPGFV